MITIGSATGSSVAAVQRAIANRAQAGLPDLPAITPHSMRRTWATFAASIGRDPKWIAAQIGHTDPQFTFSVYQQVAPRRFIDEQAIWTVMRFADEPAERARSRQLTRVDAGDPGGRSPCRRVASISASRHSPSRAATVNTTTEPIV